jgi:hypothetical protein
MKLFIRLFLITYLAVIGAIPVFSQNLEEMGKINNLENIREVDEIINRMEQKNPSAHDEQTLLLILYHKYALLKKNIDTTERMILKAEKFSRLVNKSQLAMAYYGSMLTMIGRDSKNPVKKIYYTKKGIKKIDQAVKMNANAANVRIIRGLNSISLPSFFERKNFAALDMEWIIQKVPADKKLFNDKTMSEVYYKLAEYYKETDNSQKAIHLWQVCLVKYKDTIYAKKSGQMLEIFKD